MERSLDGWIFWLLLCKSAHQLFLHFDSVVDVVVVLFRHVGFSSIHLQTSKHSSINRIFERFQSINFAYFHRSADKAEINQFFRRT